MLLYYTMAHVNMLKEHKAGKAAEAADKDAAHDHSNNNDDDNR